MEEFITVGIRTMADSVDAKLDENESQAICMLTWCVLQGGFDGNLNEAQVNWVVAAIRAAYVAGRDKRTTFKGYS